MINKKTSFCNNNSEKVIYLYTTNDISPNTNNKAFTKEIYQALLQGKEIKKEVLETLRS